MGIRGNVRVCIVGFLLVCIFTACSKEDTIEPKEVEPRVSIDRMVEEMLEVMEDPDVMELNREHIEDFYEMDLSKLEGYAVRAPLLHIHTDEIAVFKVTDRAHVEEVKESLEQRATDVQTQFKHKDPDQYEYAKNFVVTDKGNYILFVISKHATSVVDTFEQYFD